MLQLEKPAHALRVDIVGHRGTSQPNCLFEHNDQLPSQPLQVGFGEPSGLAPRPDPRSEQALVGINVSDTAQERLIQQCGLDGQSAAAKHERKLLGANREWLLACGFKTGTAAYFPQLQPPKPSGIDKADLAPAFEP